MQLENRSIHEKLPSILLASIFAVFVLTLPRFTDMSKAWFVALIMFGFFYFVFNFKQLAQTTHKERLFFAAVILNFLWMAFSFYLNGEPGRGASFLWSRHFYFIFLVALFFLFRKVNISNNDDFSQTFIRDIQTFVHPNECLLQQIVCPPSTIKETPLIMSDFSLSR